MYFIPELFETLCLSVYVILSVSEESLSTIGRVQGSHFERL